MYKFLFFIIISLFIFSCFEEDVDVDSTCSKTNLSGECSDEMSCIEGECKTLCSDTNLDGYCSDEMSCIDGECKFDMSGIKVNLINSKNDLIVSELTKKDGSFTITADNLVEVTEIRITNGDDLILRKRPGRVKYLKLSITNDKGGKLDYNFDTLLLEDSFFSDDKGFDIPILKLDKKSTYSFTISGEIDIYECIPNKTIGEPVTGAEIYIEQDPSDEPLAYTATTDEEGIFCFGEDCKGIEVQVNDSNNKGGFAVGGYRLDKANNEKSGFAVGGYRLDKSINDPYTIIIADLTLNVFRIILTKPETDGKFSINKIGFETNNQEPYSFRLQLKSSLYSWNYTCK